MDYSESKRGGEPRRTRSCNRTARASQGAMSVQERTDIRAVSSAFPPRHPSVSPGPSISPGGGQRSPDRAEGGVSDTDARLDDQRQAAGVPLGTLRIAVLKAIQSMQSSSRPRAAPQRSM